MKAVVFTGNRTLELRDFPDPEPAGDEVVIEIKASGMCGSDLHVYRSEDAGGAKFIAGQRECARFAAERNLPVEKLFTHSFALAEAREAYELFDAGKTGKCVIHPD